MLAAEKQVSVICAKAERSGSANYIFPLEKTRIIIVRNVNDRAEDDIYYFEAIFQRERYISRYRGSRRRTGERCPRDIIGNAYCARVQISRLFEGSGRGNSVGAQRHHRFIRSDNPLDHILFSPIALASRSCVLFERIYLFVYLFRE